MDVHSASVQHDALILAAQFMARFEWILVRWGATHDGREELVAAFADLMGREAAHFRANPAADHFEKSLEHQGTVHKLRRYRAGGWQLSYTNEDAMNEAALGVPEPPEVGDAAVPPVRLGPSP